MVTRRICWSLLVVGLGSSLLIGVMAAKASSNCSLATLNGTYGFIGQGTILAQLPGLPPPPFPTAGSGIATYDGNGNFSVKATQSLNGAISTGTGTGTYTVNPDCTYSDVLTVSGGPTFHEVGTITGQGIFQELHIIDIDPWFINVLTLKKTPSGRCSLATLKGGYALFGQGMVVPGPPTPPFPVAHSGIVGFDGKGSFSGGETSNSSGVFVPSTFTGTYTVNPDCTVSAVINFSDGSVLHEAGTITGVGPFQEVHNIITDAGFVFADAVKRQ